MNIIFQTRSPQTTLDYKHKTQLLITCMQTFTRSHYQCRQWRIVGSRGPGARNYVGPSAMVRPNVCQLGRQTHFGNNITNY